MDFWMTYAHPELAALHPVVSGILQTMGYGHSESASVPPRPYHA